MNLALEIKSVRRGISKMGETLDLGKLADASKEAYEALERLKNQVPENVYLALRESFELAELRGEDNCFSGHYN